MTASAATSHDAIAPILAAGADPRLAETPGKYYAAFDYLRIVLALGVFAFHGNLFGLEDRWPRSGNFCVQVFFALSGYLIGGILGASSRSALPRFYFNRSVRIWIPYSIAVAVLASACALKHQPVTAKLIEFFAYKVTFTYDLFALDATKFAQQMPLQGSGHHFWSVCAEEQFYLLAPLLITVLGRRALLGILVFGAAATAYNPGLFAAITLGVLLALSERERPRWFFKVRFLVPAIGLLGLVAGAYLRGLIVYNLAAPTASVLLVAILSYQGKPSTAGQWLGGMSYPFYLNHWIGLVVVKTIATATGLGRTGALGIALVFALLLSFAHYVFIDRRIHRRRAGWFTPKRGLVCAIAGFSLVCTGVAAHLLLRLSSNHHDGSAFGLPCRPDVSCAREGALGDEITFGDDSPWAHGVLLPARTERGSRDAGTVIGLGRRDSGRRRLHLAHRFFAARPNEEFGGNSADSRRAGLLEGFSAARNDDRQLACADGYRPGRHVTASGIEASRCQCCARAYGLEGFSYGLLRHLRSLAGHQGQAAQRAQA
jgi:peptidoglycan/LPS O-acetylase OafA/YrhL